MTNQNLPLRSLPYGRHAITESDIEAVVRVLRGSVLTQGPMIPAFEQAVAQRVGAAHAVAVNSATSALHLACLALNLRPGDRLWTSPITFVASANCARYCGADVDFVDIDPATGLMSVSALAEKLYKAAKENALPKIVVPVHLCGSSCSMEAIADLADAYGFSVLEDASHAIGGQYQGKPVGNCRYSSICVFSFHPVKIITSAEGGIATTNNPYLAQRMLDLRSHNIVKDPERFESVSPGPWAYEQQGLGFNYRLTDIQAALGLSQLQRLESIIAERNRLLSAYQQLLRDLPLRLLDIPVDVVSSLHLAVIRLNNPDPYYHLRVFKGLRSAGIGVQLHYSPVHLQPYYRKLGFTPNLYPYAEAYATNAISIPLYPSLTHDDQKYVADQLARLL